MEIQEVLDIEKVDHRTDSVRNDLIVATDLKKVSHGLNPERLPLLPCIILLNSANPIFCSLETKKQNKKKCDSLESVNCSIPTI